MKRNISIPLSKINFRKFKWILLIIIFAPGFVLFLLVMLIKYVLRIFS